MFKNKRKENKIYSNITIFKMKTMKKNKNFGPRIENARYVGPLSRRSRQSIDSPSNPHALFGEETLSVSGLREGTTILKTNVKNNSKLRPFNRILGDVGKMQYFPA